MRNKLLSTTILSLSLLIQESLANDGPVMAPPPPPAVGGAGAPPPPPPHLGAKGASKTPAKKWAVAIPEVTNPKMTDNTGMVSTLPISNLEAIEKVIKRLDVDPKKVWVAFDFDGTLSENSKSDPMHLRGREKTAEILHHLKGQGVNFILLTAGVSSDKPRAWDPFIHELTQWGIFDIFDTDSETKSQHVQDYIIKGHLTSAPHRNKYDLYKYFIAIKKGFLEKADRPQLLIFVDDSGANAIDMANSFREFYFPINVVSMHIPPRPGYGGVAGGSDETTPEQFAFIKKSINEKLKDLADFENYPK